MLPLSANADNAAWPTKPIRLLVGFPGGSTPDIAARHHRRAAGQGVGPAGGGRQQGRRLGQHRGRPGGQGQRRPHAGHRHQRQPHVVEDAIPQAALRPGQGLHLPFADRDRSAGAGGAEQPALGHRLLRRRPQGRRQVELRLGGHRLCRSPGHGAAQDPRARLQAQHVPYQGNRRSITAMLGDQVQMGLIPPGVAMPQIKAGKLKAIGLTGGRSALVPEIPPLSDAGVKDFNLEVWVALLARPNLSKVAQARISRELEAIMKNPDVRRKLFEQGWQAVGTSPDGMRTRVNEEPRS
ncbi:tripartite tricarboxylate transporter family receptor domain-containing protein [Ditylenchus destructor]|uniref:Tripartite tricarboxylate transporter family receptor domain-containing protein n=1 Tax=Ditylenchus destructor TaxID=166010 RepID=A0AAD4QVD5_9BILA|nr:tripartite tricarboxylate transporter family receptor domain-containing protein [Ditylenchus destructor]